MIFTSKFFCTVAEPEKVALPKLALSSGIDTDAGEYFWLILGKEAKRHNQVVACNTEAPVSITSNFIPESVSRQLTVWTTVVKCDNKSQGIFIWENLPY